MAMMVTNKMARIEKSIVRDVKVHARVDVHYHATTIFDFVPHDHSASRIATAKQPSARHGLATYHTVGAAVSYLVANELPISSKCNRVTSNVFNCPSLKRIDVLAIQSVSEDNTIVAMVHMYSLEQILCSIGIVKIHTNTIAHIHSLYIVDM